MKKWLSLLLAVMMVAALAVPAMAESAYDETITFTMNVIYTDRVQEDPRTQYVLDMFNIDIEFIACSSTDIAEKARLWVSGGDVPDVMWTAYGVTNPAHTEFIESGLFQPWPSLDNYPNLKAIQDSIGAAVDTSIEANGDRYWLFTEGGYMNTNQIRSIGLYYRTDWAKNVGLFHEDHTYTWDEVFEMAIAFGTQDPDGNGADDTEGLVSLTSFYPSTMGLSQNALYWDGFVPVDNAYHWRAGDADVIEAIKELKACYDAGGVWEDLIMASQNDGLNLLATGMAGICGNNWHMGQVESLVLSMRAAYPGANVLDMISPMRVINDDGSIYGQLSDGYWGEIALSANMDEEQVARFMDMFEWLASEEGFLLGAIGIPGVDYEYDADGNIVLLWDKDENGMWINPYQVNAHRFITLPRLYEGWALESPASDPDALVLGNRLNDWIQEAEVQKLTRTDWNLAVLTAETAPLYKGLALSPTVAEKVQELIISSTYETIEADWLAWVESVQGQIVPVEEELTAVVFGE